jgi:hypothetical protein
MPNPRKNRWRRCAHCGKAFRVVHNRLDQRWCDLECFGASRREATARRLWARVERGQPDECWEWQGARSDGRKPYERRYGIIRRSVDEGGGRVATHRLAWEVTNGPVPDGLQVLHSCDNPPCCNPAHLWLGTHADNMADMARKGRVGGACAW